MTPKPLESKIETYLAEQVKAVGALTYKFKSTVNGVPDRLVIFDGVTHLVEVKRPGEKPRANQVKCHQDIASRGVPVHVVDDRDAVDAFVRDVLGVHTPVERPKRAARTTIKGFDAFAVSGDDA